MRKTFCSSLVGVVLACGLVSVVAAPAMALARGGTAPAAGTGVTFTPMAPLPLTTAGGLNTTPARGTTLSITEYISNGFLFLIALAALIAVVRIVWAGILMMSTDAIYKRSEGKEIIRGAVYGLILAIGAFVIMSTISSNLTTLRFGPDPANSTASEFTPANFSPIGGAQTTAPATGGGRNIPGSDDTLPNP